MTRDYVDAMLLRPALLLFVAAIVVVVAAVVFHRRRAWSTFALLIGSVAYLLRAAMDLFCLSIMPLVAEQPDSPFFAAVWPACVPDPAFDVIGKILVVTALLCFPVGLAWTCVQSIRRT